MKINSDMKKSAGIASDHAGYQMKEFLTGYLSAKGYEVSDFGCFSEESCDYADFAHPLAAAVESGEVSVGVAICGSGEGMAMTLNKHRGVRAGLAWLPQIAELVRLHNDANVLVLPARFVTNDEAMAMVDAFLTTGFEGGRHERRIAKMTGGL